MTTLELLKAARARIERPEAWTRGTAARDPDGLGVRARSKDAVCWCAAGAVVAVSGLGAHKRPMELLRAEAGTLVSDFNDTRTHAEVLDLFDRTIARLEATS